MLFLITGPWMATGGLGAIRLITSFSARGWDSGQIKHGRSRLSHSVLLSTRKQDVFSDQGTANVSGQLKTISMAVSMG